MGDLYITCDTQWLDLESLLKLLITDLAGESVVECDLWEGMEDLFRQCLVEDVDGYPALRIFGAHAFEDGFEMIADGNTDSDQNGNWRFDIADPITDGFILQKRKADTWTNVKKWGY